MKLCLHITKTHPLIQFIYVLFSFLAAPWHKEFPGQGTDLSHSFNLSHSCRNAESLIHCAGLEIEPVTQHSQEAADPVAPQWGLQGYFLTNILMFLSST